MATIDEFKSQLVAGGVRSNRFSVYIPRMGERIEFMCKTAAIPGSTLPAIEVPFRGHKLKVAGDRTFEDWTVTIINDTDFGVRDPMERWMNGINGHAANTGLVNPVDYQADLIVDQLDRDESVIKRINIRGAFPTVLSPIELSYDTRGEIEQFTVTFSYQYWESNTTS